MLPRLLVALTASMWASLAAAASSSPVCVSSSMGYPTGQVTYLYNNFCQELANNNFASDMAVYGLPIISFTFAASGPAGSGSCTQDNCLASYKTIVDSCGLANNTIWGTASLFTECGVFNFTIWDKTENLGQATTTLIGSTMTTAATIVIATSTSSILQTSTSSEPTLIENSIISSTSVSSTASSSIEPSDISPSVSLPTSIFANSTSAAVAATRTASISESPTVVASGTSKGAETSTTTKPKVGSTALGTSGAGVLRVSGLSLVGVACMFAGFF